MATVGALGQSEAPGVLRGKITDEDFGDPLTNVRITLQELNQTVNSGEGGAYVFENVPPGVYTLTINKGGYERKFRREVLVRSGQLAEVNESLVGEVYEMDEMVVEAEDLVGGNEVELLTLRTETTALVDAISSDMLSKQGASDAADALKLVVGATVSADKTATVRGLGDRYTVVTLNNARVPSSNPVKRAVELDQFPSSMVESISVSKTFLPDMQGEASGGAVNIKTKAMPEGRIIEVKGQVGFDSQATGNDKFRTYKGAGESLGYDIDDSRKMPVTELNPALVGFPDNLSPVLNKELGEQTAKFGDVMGTTTKSPEPNQSYEIALGDRLSLSDEQAIGFLFNLDYNHDYNFLEKARRIDRDSVVDGKFNQGPALRDLTYDEGTEETSATASLNLGYQMDKDNLVQLLLFGNTVAEDKAALFQGPTNSANTLVVDQTIRHRERLLATAQLRGEHKIEAANDAEVEWFFASSFARQYDPDTRTFDYNVITQPILRYNMFDVPGQQPQRLWQTVEDESQQGGIDFKIPFDTWNEKKGFVKFGPYAEYLQRDYDISVLSYTRLSTAAAGGGRTFWNETDPNGLPGDLLTDGWFDPDYNVVGNNPNNGLLGWYLQKQGVGNVNYNGDQLIHAVYMMAELPVTERLVLTGGVRLERTEISIDIQSQTDLGTVETYIRTNPTTLEAQTVPVEDVATRITEEHWQPAVALSYEAVDNMFFRAAWSKTTARPTFRELAPTVTVAVDDSSDFVGNPDLRMSESYNYDFRWEWFPRPGTVLATSAFYKYIQDPIETVFLGSTSGSFVSKDNYEIGEVSGFEVEARTGLGLIDDLLRDLSIGANFAWLTSKAQQPTALVEQLKSVNAYDPDQPLTGTPAYLVNANFGYDNPDTGTSLNIFYNWQGETLLAGAGVDNSNETALPARFARPFDSLGIGISQKLWDHAKVSFKAKNILNNRVEEIERLANDGDRLYRSYRRGVDLTLGVGIDW